MATLKLIAIKTDKGVYISDDVSGTAYNTSIFNLLFDGEKATPSYAKNWGFIESLPLDITQVKPEIHGNYRHVLKEGYPVSEETPEVIYERYLDEDSGYSGVAALYTLVYDVVPETTERVDWELHIIDAVDGFKPVKTDYPFESAFLDKLQFHPVLLPTRPCKLDAKKSYAIIREYVKEHIDKAWAEITSDYDFCFEVKKIITLDEPEPYTVDVNNLGFNRRKRKPKFETRYRKNRSVTVLSICPAPYQRYLVTPIFEGENYEDMIAKINGYLEALIEDINRPLVDCPHCKGMGVILK